MLKIACIPAYNEQNLIGDVVRRTKIFVDRVVVCDDGSTDETAANARKAGAYVFNHKKNLGSIELAAPILICSGTIFRKTVLFFSTKVNFSTITQNSALLLYCGIRGITKVILLISEISTFFLLTAISGFRNLNVRSDVDHIIMWFICCE